MTQALLIEILTTMVSAYQGALHQLTSFSRNDCTSGISGSNMLGVSWQRQYFPFMYPNTLKKQEKKRHPPVNVLAGAKIFYLNDFPLKSAWVLFQRNFLWEFLEIWWLHDPQHTWVLHHFGNPADSKHSHKKAKPGNVLPPKGSQNQSL